jgi:hypothetical protein
VCWIQSLANASYEEWIKEPGMLTGKKTEGDIVLVLKFLNSWAFLCNILFFNSYFV